MNISYLDNLEEVKNKFNIELDDGEKVIFNASLSVFGDEKGAMLGGDQSKFILTNKRIIADNGLGVWTIDIKDDLVSCERVNDKFLIFKQVYFLVMINKEVCYGDGSMKLNGYRFYFNRRDTKKFEEIMNNLFSKNNG